jgi:hypothetical protein
VTRAWRRQPRKKPRSRSRRWRWIAAAVAAAALLFFLLRPEPETAPVEVPPPPGLARGAIAAAPPPEAPKKPKPRPAPMERAPRDALLAAVRERASTLQPCALPGGALARLPLRLHVARSGAMRSVEVTGAPPPGKVASCVRAAAMAWDFRDLKLPSDVELLVAISFAPGA